MRNPLVIIFLKAPRAGWVKTRLAAAVGPERALEMYRRLGARQWNAIPAEFAAEANGYTATKHQREVGAGYFDDVTQTVTGGKSSITAMRGSTEEAQFKAR